MEQKKLKAELSRGELKNVYLLHGKERFLISHYADEIEKICGAKNKDLFDGIIPVEQIIMAAETLPFSFDANEKRLILVRDSKLFAMSKKDDETAGRKAESEKMAEYVPKIPADTVIIFIETEVDKRTRLYKKAAELGGAVDFVPLAPQELIKWLAHYAKQSGKKFQQDAVELLIRTCGTDMFNLKNETDKLIFHADENTEITHQDIAEISTPTLESRIFDMLEAMITCRIDAALKMYNDLLTLKEPPFRILALIIREIRITLLCKCLAEKNIPFVQIASQVKIPDFAVGKAIAKNISREKLIVALENCQDTDIRIKSGLITPELGVEMLIISIG
ncbi:MAG: DNA polymerase III subunit delta [Defluviitaleaceae bacterium]|nr:DNA polymerase III subunit delta [Defluviitaleaceae bacterium]